MQSEIGMKRPRFSMKNFLRDNGPAYLFLLPWIIGLCVLTLGPMVSSLYLSFTTYDLLTSSEWIGLGNYEKMFLGDPRYMNALKVTFIFVFTSVPFKLIFALIIALLLNKGLRGLGFYRTVYYIPTLLGGSVAIAVIWKKMFSSDGVLNQIVLGLFGYQGPDWVANPKYAIYSIVALSAWQFGSTMIIFLAGLKQVPTEFYEAAKVDGASKMRQFFNVTLPLITPVVLFNIVIQMISAFQSFTQAFIISGGSGGPIDSTLFYTLYLYIKGFTLFEMGYASAMAWILLLIISIFTALVFRSSRYWVNYGDGGK